MPPPQKANVIFSSVPQSSRSELLRTAIATAVQQDDVTEGEQAFSTPSSIPDDANSYSDDVATDVSTTADDSLPPPAPELQEDLVSEIVEKNSFTRTYTITQSQSSSSKDVGDDVISELKSFNGLSPLKGRRAQPDYSRRAENRVEQTTDELPDEDDRDFLKDIPETDSQGREIPAWRRQLLARKLAEQTKMERKDRLEREKEERRLAKMPRWKRELEARRNQEPKISIQQ